MCIFKRNCWDSVLGVKSEHLGLLVGLGHVDIERITLDVLLGHRKVHNNSNLDLVNKSQSFGWDKTRKMKVKDKTHHSLEHLSSPVHTQRGLLSDN